MSHNDESFFREVEEDYRRDQTIKFFQAYGAYFIAGAFVILALVGGYTFQQNRRAHQAAAGGDALSNAIILSEAGKQDEAQKALAALAENGPGSYKIWPACMRRPNRLQKTSSMLPTRNMRAWLTTKLHPRAYAILRGFSLLPYPWTMRATIL